VFAAQKKKCVSGTCAFCVSSLVSHSGVHETLFDMTPIYVLQTDVWQMIMTLLHWVDVHELWLTGNKYMRRMLHTSSTMSLVPSENRRRHKCARNTGPSLAYLNNMWLFDHGPKTSHGAYLWALQHFQGSISHLSTDWIELKTNIHLGLMSMTPNWLMGWTSLKYLELYLPFGEIMKLEHDITLPTTVDTLVVHLNLPRVERQEDVAPNRGHRIIAPGLNRLDIFTRSVYPFDSESWIYKSLLVPNGNQLTSLSWNTTAMPIERRPILHQPFFRRNWLDFRIICPKLTTLSIKSAVTMQEMSLSLPSSMTSLSLKCDLTAEGRHSKDETDIPLLNTVHSELEYFSIYCLRLNEAEIDNLFESCPNIATLKLEVGILPVQYVQSCVAKYFSSLKRVSSTTFEILEMWRPNVMPPQLEAITPKLELVLPFGEPDKQYDNDLISGVFNACSNLKRTYIDITTSIDWPSTSTNACRQILTHPKLRSLMIHGSTTNDPIDTNNEHTIFSVADYSIYASRLCVKIQSIHVDPIVQFLCSKCKNVVDFGLWITTTLPVEAGESTYNVSLPPTVKTLDLSVIDCVDMSCLSLIPATLSEIQFSLYFLHNTLWHVEQIIQLLMTLVQTENIWKCDNVNGVVHFPGVSGKMVEQGVAMTTELSNTVNAKNAIHKGPKMTFTIHCYDNGVWCKFGHLG